MTTQDAPAWLLVRAIIVCNRDKDQAAKYVAKHMALMQPKR